MSSRKSAKMDKLAEVVNSLGIDFKALNHYEQRILLEKVETILKFLDPPDRLRELVDVINAIYELCGLPKIIALNMIYDATKLCADTYPPIRNVLRELTKRYKLVDRGCIEAVASALSALDLFC